MARKERQIFPLPGDVGHSFEDDDRILTYRPKIEYEEPPQIDIDSGIPSTTEGIQDEYNDQLTDYRNRTKALIDGYAALAKLADIAQQRIDNRVETLGGLEVELDPVTDASVIAAIKRRFPELVEEEEIDPNFLNGFAAGKGNLPGTNLASGAAGVQPGQKSGVAPSAAKKSTAKKKDPNKITYDMYKKALDCIQRLSPNLTSEPVSVLRQVEDEGKINERVYNPDKEKLVTITDDDIIEAKADPYRSDFGLFAVAPGKGRPELDKNTKSVKPIDLVKFQSNAITSLFKMMMPMIMKLIIKIVFPF